jgi:hypothetical protein
MAVHAKETASPQGHRKMTYEIFHGQRTHFIQAGNPWAACLDSLRIEAEEDDVQQSPFRVTSLLNGHDETITMEEVLSIQLLAVSGCDTRTYDKRVAPHIDLTRW